MKKIVIIAVGVVVLLSLLSCSTTSLTSTEKMAARERVRLAVEEKIHSGEFIITVSRAIPMRGRDIALTSLYDLKIAGDSVYSYLPYFGRGYSLQYPDGGGGLTFNGIATEYNHSKTNKGWHRIEFDLRVKSELYTYLVEIGNGGEANILVQPSNRSSIRFIGTLNLDD